MLLRLSCVSKSSKSSVESESDTASSSPPSFESSSPSIDDDRGTDPAAYKWCAALGGVGFLETAYLSYLKFTDTDAFCPTGGASCTTILTSGYSYVFGFPLPLFGMLAYGLVTTIGLQLGAKKMAFGLDKTDGEMIIIGTTTSMAAASAYFLYILSTEFPEESCLYCLTSAVLSFSLFFITLKNLGFEKIIKMLGSQLCIASLVVLALSASYKTVQPVSSSQRTLLYAQANDQTLKVEPLSGTRLKWMSESLAENEIPYVATEITKESSPLAISLARHLHSIGAKLYGAFWCSHCLDQKEMFGREAAKILDYVECFPNGVKQGTKMADACYDIKLEGFPTWEINGQVLSGEKQLSELAILSGMKPEDLSQQN
ncbi:hypothetical protein RD792_013057 [Penstemon davidsonii]|uniref:Vitamin K epoxide reductase domain-containing protein n=1 Tax=Penstemon davidsonii TaxID=160366 RepID=A0ABR0CSD7_9LAMI|nr:hypothetical protein RD792_013057 [Penstemon davidsonii]